MIARFDHFAIAAETLAEGTAHTEVALGMPLGPGGHHPLMATHNRLMRLGPGEYLEVIAIDPDAPSPGRPRWFDLDRFEGPPRITNWILRCDDLDAALALAPEGTGTPMALTRGDLAWRMAVPADGQLPFDGAFPALIQWQGAGHATDRLEDAGCALVALTIRHPEATALAAALEPLLDDPRIRIEAGPAKEITAEIDTPSGRRRL